MAGRGPVLGDKRQELDDLLVVVRALEELDARVERAAIGLQQHAARFLRDHMAWLKSGPTVTTVGGVVLRVTKGARWPPRGPERASGDSAAQLVRSCREGPRSKLVE